MSRGEEYITVQATLKAKTDKAVRIETGACDEGAWVPRSTLHFSSDKAVDDAEPETALELRIMAWVVDREGLA